MTQAILLSAPPPDFLQNPIFQFIANAIIAIAAIIVTSIVTIWVYKKQQQRKELSYEVISEASVISIGESVANKVKIELDGHPVKEVTLAVLKVTNTGNTAIRKDDYEDPLTFVFKGRKAVSCEVVETEPADLIDEAARKIFLQVPASAQESLEFPKFLLNPKQSITFSVLLDGAKGEISRRGRIIDGEIKQIRNSESNRGGTAVLFMRPVMLIILIVLLIMPLTVLYSQFIDYFDSYRNGPYTFDQVSLIYIFLHLPLASYVLLLLFFLPFIIVLVVYFLVSWKSSRSGHKKSSR